jgi:hypothetical protein
MLREVDAIDLAGQQGEALSEIFYATCTIY